MLLSLTKSIDWLQDNNYNVELRACWWLLNAMSYLIHLTPQSSQATKWVNAAETVGAVQGKSLSLRYSLLDRIVWLKNTRLLIHKK